MAATFALADLCRLVLSDVYGDLASQVVGVLFDHGRQTAMQISKRTKLPISTVHRTIVALLQNRFLLFWSEPNSKAVHYYANWQQIYGVLWNGAIVAKVNSKHEDDLAAEVVQNVLVSGNMRASDYIEFYEDKQQVTRLMTQLVRDKVLFPVQDFEFHPIEDIRATMLKRQLQLVKNDLKFKSDSARNVAANAAADKERDELLMKKDEPNVGLIKNEASAPGTKKRARRGADLFAVEQFELDTEAILGVNYEKYLVHARNDELVRQVEQRIGPVTAGVYKRVLDVYLPKLARCQRESYAGKEFNISTREVSAGLPDSLDVDGAINTTRKRTISSKSNSKGSKRRKTEDGGYEENDDEDDDEMDDEESDKSDSDDGAPKKKGPSMHTVSQHLDLLADCNVRFLKKVTMNEWHVPFNELVEDLRRVSYQTIIADKFGPIAARVLRIVAEKGKCEERQLSGIALLKQADIRQQVSNLHEVGALELQEVPRSNDRAPTRSFYLWFHDKQRAYSHIVQDLYVTMHHLYSRLFAERKESYVLLAKLEREDVKSNESLYLSEQEKRELNSLRSKEEKLLVQMARVDSLVKIFRDY